uniref:Chloride channel protein n=1 Tax=Ralstonia solanacearum TaxID=305 RepID=A0A0S4V8Z3_RALSL|nr:protein of unknown function [Ralstonia solanacearum]
MAGRRAVGSLAAVTQSPITSFVIVMEMIDGHEMVLPLVAVALLSSQVSRAMTPSFYLTLAHRFRAAVSHPVGQ